MGAVDDSLTTGNANDAKERSKRGCVRRSCRAKGPCSGYRVVSIDAEELSPLIDAAAFGSGDYPYDKKMKADDYDRDLQALQIELLRGPGLGALRGRARRHRLRGARRGRQGRRHLSPDAAPQSALGAHRRAVEAQRGRGRPMVFPALCRPSADQGRDRDLRPLLVQSRRRRACDGLLHARGDRAFPPRGADLRGLARPRRRSG